MDTTKTSTEVRTVKEAHHIAVARQIQLFRGAPLTYFHHGLLFRFSDGSHGVIHYSGTPDSAGEGVVQKATLSTFLRGSPIQYCNDTDKAMGLTPFSPEEVLKRAETRLGERKYNLLSNNCEHFANDCMYGRAVSKQVEFYLTLFGGFMQMATSNITMRSSPEGENGAQTQIQIVEETSTIEWACMACTYINAPRRPTCEMCETPKARRHFV